VGKLKKKKAERELDRDRQPDREMEKEKNGTRTGTERQKRRMGTRTVGYKQGAEHKIAEREVQGSRKNDREKKSGGREEFRELEKGKILLESSTGGWRKTGSRAEKRRKKISDGEHNRGLEREK